MTAEETALEEFRRAVADVRYYRRVECGPFGFHDWAMDRVRSLARIIRAIRAERVVDNLALKHHGEGYRTGYTFGHEHGYEQGRRDTLRGVQGACLFEAGDGNPFFTSNEDAIRGVALLDIAKAAEEAAL